jgi:teichuronic acid exporter
MGKVEVFSAGIWNLIERTYNQIISFGLNIFLARLLFPSDYGMIGMIAIFIAISTSFVEGGFINALIQKQDRSEDDFSTTFYFNISIAIVFYLILFFSAPFVSLFYNEIQLTNVMRVVSLSIIFNAFSIVPRTKIAINLDFKKQATITSIAITTSGIISIILAYKGVGVWALVFQSISVSFLNALFLALSVKWRPKLNFSIKGFKELFSFGSKLLISNLIDRIFRNINYLIIGKFYSAAQLGFYTRAEQFSQLPSSNIAGVIQSVTFPKMCEIQNNNLLLRASYIRYIKIAAFLTFPILLFLSFYAKPLIIAVLTEKWIMSAPLLSLLSIVSLLYPINFLNMNLLMAKRKTTIYLKLELIKKGLIIIMLIITVRFGITAIIYGQILVAIISLYINSYYTDKIIDYGFFKQLNDLFPLFLVALFSVIISYFLTNVFINNLLKVATGLLIMPTIYFSFFYLTNLKNIKKEFDQLIWQIKNR